MMPGEPQVLRQCATKRDALHKIERWAPSGARFFRILAIRRDTRSAFDSRFRSPYFEVEVGYSQKVGEGFRPLPSGAYDDPRLVSRQWARYARRGVQETS